MRDAAADADAAQSGKDLVDCPARVEEDWQAGSAGNLQLLKKEVLLPFAVGLADKKIEPDLADRDRRLGPVRFLLQPRPQAQQILLVGVVDVKRVYAVRRNTGGMTPATTSYGGKLVGVHRGDDEGRDAGGLGSGNDGSAICGKFDRSEMAMRVDHDSTSLLRPAPRCTCEGFFTRSRQTKGRNRPPADVH